MKLTKYFKDFFRNESASGIILIFITALTLITVNFILEEKFQGFWKSDLLGKPLDFWINDLLMTFFFLLVGLEFVFSCFHLHRH